MLRKPVEKGDAGKQPQHGGGFHDGSKGVFSNSLPLAQKHQHQDNEESNATDCEFDNWPCQSHQSGFHVCPFGKNPESYLDALLGVISDPFFIGPVAFAAGLFVAASAIQGLGGVAG